MRFKKNIFKKNTRKGQVAIIDLFIAIAVFIILITITTLTWDLYNIRLDIRIDYDDMMIRAFQISDSLVKSSGYPGDWEKTSNPSIIGLAEADRVLSKDKVSKFTSLNYNNVKDKMKINLYDYYFLIRNAGGDPIITSGVSPSGNYVVNLARIVVYDNEPAIMEFALWR